MILRVGGFFSGIGAHVSACDRLVSEGVRFEHVFSCECDNKTSLAFDVIHSNHPKIQNLGNITKVDNIGGDLRVDILFTTPPCQDLSIAGKKAGCAQGSGTRSSLMFETPRILRNTPRKDLPKWIVMEEVPMLISKKFMPFFMELLAQMSDLGYQHEFGIINAADMGVAQSRRRMFCISRLGAPAPKLPEPIPLDKCLRDYLDSEPVHPRYYLNEERFKGLIWNSGREKDSQKTLSQSDRKAILINEGMGYVEAHEGDGIKLIYPTGPESRNRVRTQIAPTLMAGPVVGVVVRNNDMDCKIRKLTERESLRLMTFTDEEIDRLKNAQGERGKPLFSMTNLYKFAGNSVVVECYRHILKEIVGLRKDTGGL